MTTYDLCEIINWEAGSKRRMDLWSKEIQSKLVFKDPSLSTMFGYKWMIVPANRYRDTRPMFYIMNSLSMSDVLTPATTPWGSDGDGARYWVTLSRYNSKKESQLWYWHTDGERLYNHALNLVLYLEGTILAVGPRFSRRREGFTFTNKKTIVTPNNALALTAIQTDFTIDPIKNAPNLAAGGTQQTGKRASSDALAVFPVFPPLAVDKLPDGELDQPYMRCWYDKASLSGSIEKVTGLYGYATKYALNVTCSDSAVAAWRVVMLAGVCNGGDATGKSWFISSSDKGAMCRIWDNDRSPNTEERNTHQKMKDSIKNEWCKANPKAEECKCINRINDETYKLIKPSVPTSDHCWYSECSAGSSARLLTTDMVKSDYFTPEACPSAICSNIINVVNSSDIDLGKVQQITNCNINTPEPNKPTTGGSDPKKTDPVVVNLGDNSSIDPVIYGGAALGISAVIGVGIGWMVTRKTKRERPITDYFY